MGLKEYEVDTPAGKATLQLSDEDAERRGLTGGTSIDDAQEFNSATGAPGVPEPVSSPETPTNVVDDDDDKTQRTPTKREQAASKAFGAKNK